MAAALQRQLRRTKQHLGGVALRLLPGKADIDRAVGQRFHKQTGKGTAAAGHGTAGVDQAFVQLLQHSGAAQQGDKALPLGLCHIVGAAVHGDALAHLHSGIGHDADHRIVAAGHFPNACDGQARRHAQQHEGSGALPQDGSDFG